MLHTTIQRAINVLITQTTDGHIHIARGDDDLIRAAAKELSKLRAKVKELQVERDEAGGWVRTKARPKPNYLIDDVRDGLAHGLFVIDLAMDMRNACELNESSDRNRFQKHLMKHVGDAAAAWLSEWQPKDPTS